MMFQRCFPTAGLCCLLLCVVVDYHDSVRAAEPGVTLTATTWPPGQEMKPGVSVLIQVRGMEQVDGGASQPKTKWHIVPAYDDDATMLFYDMDRQPMLFFAGSQPGTRTIFLQVESPGLDSLPRCDFEYGKVGPKPDPGPTPDPNPPPPPPGPLAEMWVIVVEETSQRTPEQARVLLDPTVRQWMANHQHHFRILDKDQTSTDLTEWIERAAAQTETALPYLFIVDDSGVVSFEGPLPIGPLEMLSLVKKWGTEK